MKENINKKSLIISISTLVILTILLTSVITWIIISMKNNKSVSDKIFSYCKAKNEISFNLKLSEFTDFDWDYVIIYKNTTKKDILDKTGVNYPKELDLLSGMIFIKNNKIVYDDKFKLVSSRDIDSPYKISIEPYRDINSKEKIRKLTKKEAIFTGKKLKYDNKTIYKFYPIN